MEFNVEKTVNEIILFIKDYFNKNHLKGAVVGISGGKDSAVVAALFTKALGSDNVVGLWMPCHSKEEDKKDAMLLSRDLNIPLIENDLTMLYDIYLENIKKINEVSDDDLIDANINLKPRLRMSTLYYYAAMLSRKKKAPYIVAGTSNKCERYVGYFTKGGDNIADISVLGELIVSEVIKIGEYLKIREHIIHKTPEDGISGKTDEEKLGVKYSDIEKYLHKEPLDIDIKKKIEELHERNLHKFIIPTYRSNL